MFFMPRPWNERQAIEEELAELPPQIASNEREFEATPKENRFLRENLLWRIRRDQMRIADLRARLTRL